MQPAALPTGLYILPTTEYRCVLPKIVIDNHIQCYAYIKPCDAYLPNGLIERLNKYGDTKISDWIIFARNIYQHIDYDLPAVIYAAYETKKIDLVKKLLECIHHWKAAIYVMEWLAETCPELTPCEPFVVECVGNIILKKRISNKCITNDLEKWLITRVATDHPIVKSFTLNHVLDSNRMDLLPYILSAYADGKKHRIDLEVHYPLLHHILRDYNIDIQSDWSYYTVKLTPRTTTFEWEDIPNILRRNSYTIYYDDKQLIYEVLKKSIAIYAPAEMKASLNNTLSALRYW